VTAAGWTPRAAGGGEGIRSSKEITMGQPVVHFEIIGADGPALHSYYSQLFGWTIDADNPVGYGLVGREDNVNADGIGIGGGIAGSEGTAGYVTFYVEVADVDAALTQAESLGGARVMGPYEVRPGTLIGQLTDPEGHLVGVVSNS
jgi:predicted enzyme related to lactoylglutathione lyase